MINKLIFPILLIINIFITGCSENEPEIYPIRFNQQNYTVMLGQITYISYVDGSGVYDVEIENQDIIGNAYINTQNYSLVITPAATGKSTITVKDIKTDTTVTLNITVTDFYLSFKVETIDGNNVNPYIDLNSEIQFVRTVEGKRLLRIVNTDDTDNQQKTVANGTFDMVKEDNVFILKMSLDHNVINELKLLFTYSVKGTQTVYDVFNHYFDYNWEKYSLPRSYMPMQVHIMNLTDIDNDCTISTKLLPFHLGM